MTTVFKNGNERLVKIELSQEKNNFRLSDIDRNESLEEFQLKLDSIEIMGISSPSELALKIRMTEQNNSLKTKFYSLHEKRNQFVFQNNRFYLDITSLEISIKNYIKNIPHFEIDIEGDLKNETQIVIYATIYSN